MCLILLQLSIVDINTCGSTDAYGGWIGTLLQISSSIGA